MVNNNNTWHFYDAVHLQSALQT